jgi:hypothetical protein
VPATILDEDVLKTVIDKDDIYFPVYDATMQNLVNTVLYGSSSGDDDSEYHTLSDVSDDDEDDMSHLLQNPLLDVDDENDNVMDKAMHARVIAELMSLRSKHKIPKKHIEEFLQVCHRAMGFSTKQHRSIPSTYAEVDRHFVLSKAKYVKVSCEFIHHHRHHAPSTYLHRLLFVPCGID